MELREGFAGTFKRQFLILKPAASAEPTVLTVFTDRRFHSIRLVPDPSSYTPIMSFRFPDGAGPVSRLIIRRRRRSWQSRPPPWRPSPPKPMFLSRADRWRPVSSTSIISFRARRGSRRSGSTMMARYHTSSCRGPAVPALAVLLLSACSGGVPWTSASRSVPLSEAQYRAVDHDRAPGRRSRFRALDHPRVAQAPHPVRELHAPLPAPRRLRSRRIRCVSHVQRELAYSGESAFQATASVGRTLKISRIYEPGDGGVYPVSPVSVMRLSARTVWRAPVELIRNSALGS